MKEQRIFAEDRVRATVQARLHSAGVDSEVTIVDASERGLQLAMPVALRPGEIVEIEIGGQALAGWVRSRTDQHCDIVLEEAIDVMTLLESSRAQITITRLAASGGEQRHPLAVALASDGPLPARMMQAAFIVALLLLGIVAIVQLVDLAGGPLQTARIALEGGSDLSH